MSNVDNSLVDFSHPLRWSSSLRLSRSRSSSLFSDSIPFESGRFTRYERLSESMRFPGEPSLNSRIVKGKKRRSKAWVLISRVFSFRRSDTSDEVARGDAGVKESDHPRVVEKAVKPRRSSWLPDPNRRWPIQGW